MISENLKTIYSKIPKEVTLLAVSKSQSCEAIQEAYKAGQRDFGENYIQELREKQKVLPKNISWHLIGKLQSNKIKYIVHFINFIHSIESLKQLKILDKEASKYGREIKCLLQIKVSKDLAKSGINARQAGEILDFLKINPLKNIQVIGLMGLASQSPNKDLIKKEFSYLEDLFNKFKTIYKDFYILSMGMSSDYKLAIEAGSNMIRIGAKLFGQREL